MTRTRLVTPVRSVGRSAGVLLAAIAVVLSLAPAATASSSPATAQSAAAGGRPAVAARRACATPGKGAARCHALERTDVVPHAVRDALAAPAVISGYTPAQLQSAYGLTSAALAKGTGLTVAVVDAYDSPTAESDLAAYRAQFGLPACTTANGCFRKVNQDGSSAVAGLPPFNDGWAREIALDLDMVSAICPNCSILLVEAQDAMMDNLGASVNTAVALGARFVSNSYGGPEFPDVDLLDGWYYDQPGVVITASTGDYGFENEGAVGFAGNEYPAVSPHVVAVGGTRLVTAANARGWSESAWSGAGSGCSLYEPKPAWQKDTGCATRMVADVSAVADPATGVAVVYNGFWGVLGGTSAAAPVIAAAYALAGTPATESYPVSFPYSRRGLNDAVGGNNGSCSPSPAYWCNGVVGYDGPTGLGTPSGTTPFTGPSVPGKPGTPTGVAGPTSVALTWTAPASNGSPITAYKVTAAPGGKSCTATATACTVAGLASGAAYTFTVRATNAIGTGPASDPSAPVVALGPPGAPTGVVGIPGNASALVAWAAPAWTGGAAITAYTATASPGGKSCTVSAATSCTVTGLANGSPYTFTVTAANTYGTGPASGASTAVTPRTVPGTPGSVTALPGNRSALVGWTAPASNGGAPVTGYTVTASPGGTTCAWSSGPLECLVAGLANGTSYTFRVTAANAAGAGPAAVSAAVAPAPVPGSPTGVSLLPAAPAYGAIRAAWTAPATDGGSPITSYRATAYLAASGASTGHSCTTSGTPAATKCIITGLTTGTAVVVRVTATTAVGTGLPSARSLPLTPPTAPAARIASVPLWSTALPPTISWVGTPGTNPIASYDVRYRKASWWGGFGASTGWLAATAATSASFPATPGNTYCFSVRARDSMGYASSWSAETCLTAPLDDRALTRSGTWYVGTNSAYYRGTYVRSSTSGTAASIPGVRAKRIALVATTCATCGTVKVYLGSTLLRTVSLVSDTTVTGKVIWVATFDTVKTGTLSIRVSSSGLRVVIDGLGISAV